MSSTACKHVVGMGVCCGGLPSCPKHFKYFMNSLSGSHEIPIGKVPGLKNYCKFLPAFDSRSAVCQPCPSAIPVVALCLFLTGNDRRYHLQTLQTPGESQYLCWVYCSRSRRPAASELLAAAAAVPLPALGELLMPHCWGLQLLQGPKLLLHLLAEP